MFTGIVEHTGRIRTIVKSDSGARLVVSFDAKESLRLRKGDSVAVNGVCLTVVETGDGRADFDVVQETLKKSDLGSLKEGETVNIELPMAFDGRFGGHFVLGHIDGVGTIVGKYPVGGSDESIVLRVDVSREIGSLMVKKGSVALDGVSLTLVDVGDAGFSCALIPYTLAHTTLGRKGVGDKVNVETDILGKYVRKFWESDKPSVTITPRFLSDAGFRP